MLVEEEGKNFPAIPYLMLLIINIIHLPEFWIAKSNFLTTSKFANNIEIC
jgi:hypothetical protein